MATQPYLGFRAFLLPFAPKPMPDGADTYERARRRRRRRR